MAIGVVVAISLARRATFARIAGSRLAVFVAAVRVMWAGMALRFWAFRTLGRYFTFTVQTSPDQEDALHATLGERYANYASGRKRLVPFLW